MPVENEKEIQQLKNRYKELAEKSFSQNIYTFTPFLGLAEQDIFHRIEKELSYAGYTLFGGEKDCDRIMIRFGQALDMGYEVDFPISCIHVEPLMPKFADALTHRDFLGALMNLGIDRSLLGDIKVGEKEAYLFCNENIAGFICENLCKVKHTSVSCTVTKQWENIQVEGPKERVIMVASLRVDVLVSKVYNISRAKCDELFRSGKVYVNGMLSEQKSRTLKIGDVVNVRGQGKFVLRCEAGITKKGKNNISVAVFN